MKINKRKGENIMDKNKVKKLEEISNDVEKEMSDFDILDVLLDQNDTDPIVLEDDKGKRIRFEQVAIVPYDNKIYAVLKPIDKIEGVKDDEAIVFLCDETTKPTTLRPEADQEIAIKIFDEYYNLVEEANKEAAKNKKKKERSWSH